MWMQTKAHDDDDERLNLHRIRSLAYMEECIAWNADGNFDRVSAAGMLFLLREDRVKERLLLKKMVTKLASEKAMTLLFLKTIQILETNFSY
jgi:hypothetical protein